MQRSLLPDPELDSVDHRVARLIAEQHGVITRSQLRACGRSDRAISGRVQTGTLHRVARSVFALAPLTSRESWWLAAVLACGDRALLSHTSASALWQIDRSAERGVPGLGIHVTVPSRRAPGVPVLAHRTSSLVADDRIVHTGIPVTSLERTIVDLGSMRTEFQLADVVSRAHEQYDLDLDRVVDALDRRRGLTHADTVRGAVALFRSGSRGTRSELEDRFIALLLETRIPLPRLNTSINFGTTPIDVDAIWDDLGVIVEFESRTSRSDEELQGRALAFDRLGYTVHRLRWIDLATRIPETVRRLRALTTA